MSFVVRQAWESDLERLVRLVMECQQDPERSSPALSRDAPAVRAEIREIEGTEAWPDVTWVALDDDRRLLGWIAAESDASMGRVWWVGPFVSAPGSPLTPAVTDALLATARTSFGGFAEEELAIDVRSDLLANFAQRNGFVAQEGSVALRLEDLDVVAPPTPAGVTIGPADPADVEAMALHDALFPGTHSTGEYLFAMTGDRHDRLVAHRAGVVVGYVATKLEHDGSLYVDYLGVAPECRGEGVGRSLVAMALRARADEATHAHLTVRVSNHAARRLYASIGFVDELTLVPYRIGFSID